MRAVVCLIALSSLAQAAPVPRADPPDPLGKGYLGIAAAGEGSLVINRVEPNTPASAAGLLKGDIFVRVGPLAPENFDEVREMIGCLRPGTRITITVRRGKSEKTTVLALDNRPPNFGMTQIEPEP